MTRRTQPLLPWQRSLYDDNHRDRATLVAHALTNPVFLLGNIALVSAPFTSPWAALGGLTLMVLAMAAQGRAHARERVPPVPFEGAFDAAARIFAEQWITFPRFVIDGGFARAWRAARGESAR